LERSETYYVITYKKTFLANLNIIISIIRRTFQNQNYKNET
jgi:hypothetical protein